MVLVALSKHVLDHVYVRACEAIIIDFVSTM